MRKYLYLISITLCLQGCVTWRTSLQRDGDQDIAIKNAIIDVSNADKKFIKDDSVYIVSVHKLQNGLIEIRILGEISKFSVVNNTKIDSSILPTRYYEYKNRLFYWNDPHTKFSNEILLKLQQYRQIEYLSPSVFVEWRTDDSKEEIIYYFCSNNLLRYKKLKTSGAYYYWYEIMPEMKCN